MKRQFSKTKIAILIVLNIFILLGLICSIELAFNESFRTLIIRFGENNIVHKQLNFEYWNDSLLEIGSSVISIVAIFIVLEIFSFLPIGKRFYAILKQDFLNFQNDSKWNLQKRDIIVFSVIVLIYLAAFFSLLRNGISYGDDWARNATGHYGWLDWGRYFAEILQFCIYLAFTITDISPLPQFMAILFLSLSSFLICKLFSEDGKIKVAAIFPSVILGISPYFLGCMSFKYDSVAMAFSVLITIIPFVFYKAQTEKLKTNALFYSSAALCLFLMESCYQASSGIFIVMTAFIGLYMFSRAKIELKDFLFFAIKSACVYVVVSLIYKFITPFHGEGGYQSDIISLAAIPSTTAATFTCMFDDFRQLWDVLIILVCIFCVVCFYKNSAEDRKKISLCLSIASVIFCSIFSFGAYILLEQPYLLPRGMYGFFVFVCIASVYVVSNSNLKIFTIPSFLLTWNFIVFSSAYGNALSAQHEMNRYYTNTVQADLNELLCDEKETDFRLYCDSVPFCPTVKVMALAYPVVLRLIEINCDKAWINAQLRFTYLDVYETKRIEADHECAPRLDISQDWALLKKTRFYSIWRSGDNIYIENDF